MLRSVQAMESQEDKQKAKFRTHKEQFPKRDYLNHPPHDWGIIYGKDCIHKFSVLETSFPTLLQNVAKIQD